jgi:hypothetical protein
MPVTAAAIAGGAKLIGGLFSGIGKRRAAKRRSREGSKLIRRGEAAAEKALAFREENPFEIPDEARASLALAQNELGTNRIQQALEEKNNAALASSAGLVKRTATSGSDALAAISKLQGQTNELNTQAAVAGAQERNQDIGNVLNANQLLADYHGIQYDQNVNMPFLQRLELAQGKIAAGYSLKGAATQAEIDSSGLTGNLISGAGSFLGGLYSAKQQA